MSEIKLKRCPFCGGEVEFHEQEHHMNNFWNKNTIYCPVCDFRMEGVSRFHLFKKWNTRKPMQEIVEKLEEDYVDARNSVDIEEDYYLGMCQGLQYAICHVKEVGVLDG